MVTNQENQEDDKSVLKLAISKFNSYKKNIFV